jgi:cell division protease FtsH
MRTRGGQAPCRALGGLQQGVQDRGSATDVSEEKSGQLTVKDEDQTVTGLLKEENGKQQELEYSYPEYYDIADFFNEANIAFTTDPQNTGFWLTLLGTLGPIVLIILFFILFMSADHEASDPTCSGRIPRYNQTYAPILWKF